MQADLRKRGRTGGEGERDRGGGGRRERGGGGVDRLGRWEGGGGGGILTVDGKI